MWSRVTRAWRAARGALGGRGGPVAAVRGWFRPLGHPLLLGVTAAPEARQHVALPGAAQAARPRPSHTPVPGSPRRPRLSAR